MQGARYSPYKRNASMDAVREGRIDRVREIITTRGPREWKGGYSLLSAAVENKHTEVAKLLLTSGSRVNSRYKNPCNTPLHFAVLNGDIEIVQMLLDKGANIDAKNMLGKTPLHNAVGGIKTEIIGMLLNRGANIDAADKSSITPLHLAIKNGSNNITMLLLSRGANVEGEGNSARTSRRIAANRGNGSTPLHLAVRKGNEEITELLLSKGANVNARENDDTTPLHIATRGRYLKIVLDLLKYGADFNSTTRNGRTPLYLAVENHREKIVKLLLECGACVDAKDKNDKSILHLAVEEGSSIIVGHILKHRPDLNDNSNSRVLNVAVQGCGTGYRGILKNLLLYGFTVDPKDANNFMRAAVEEGHVELVGELLKHGADVNTLYDSTFGKDSIPLHVATINGHEEVAKLLISYGADVNAPDEIGKTAIFYATENADLKMAKLLLTNKANASDDPELLTNAVREEYREMVEVLLQHGADVNAIDKFGRMPLTVVILNDREINVRDRIAEFLLSRGVNVNSRVKNSVRILYYDTGDSHEKFFRALRAYNFETVKPFTSKRVVTPLHLSVLIGNNEIMGMLLKKGANVNAKDGSGETALHYATEKGNTEVVEILLIRGAEVDAASNYRRMTPLHIAAEFGYLDIVELLLKFGGKVDSTRNRNALTPFQLAARNSHLEIVKLLLKLGANVDSADDDGLTALHFACTKADERIATALLEHGADVTIRCRSYYTALGYAMHGNDACLPADFDDLDDDFEYLHPYVNVAKILKRHALKITAADLYTVHDAILSIPLNAIGSDDVELCDFQDECEEEVTSMKSEKFVNTNITFYDILTKDVSQLAMYVRNESIVEAFGSGDYKEKFPIYGSMISINFRKGERQKECLDQGIKIFHFLFNNFPELPRVCTEHILSYLNNDDLRALTGAGKRLVYCQQS